MTETTNAPPQQHQRKGLAVAALVLGLVALVGCFIPLFNVGSIIIAVVGLALGIPALVLSRHPTHGSRGMAIAGSVLSVVAIVVAVVVNVAVVDAADQAITDTENGFSTVAPEQEQAAEEPALDLGQETELGDYAVAVTSVTKDAGEDIAAENEFNEPADGQYVVADLAVTYNGDEQGDPWIDLSVDYQGTDARDYSTSTCDAVVGNSAGEQPTLRSGGSTTYSVCFDVPAEAVDTGRVAVEEGLGLNEDPAYWAVP